MPETNAVDDDVELKLKVGVAVGRATTAVSRVDVITLVDRVSQVE